MEKFYKIGENKFIGLLADSLRLNALMAEGVDNWSWYGANFREFLEEAMKEEGLNLEDEDEDFSFRDLAKLYLKDYPEV